MRIRKAAGVQVKTSGKNGSSTRGGYGGRLGGATRVAAPLLRYWWHSASERCARGVRPVPLIATRLDEHMALAREAEAMNLLRPIGWLQLYATAEGLERAMSRADGARREFGVNCVPPGR